MQLLDGGGGLVQQERGVGLAQGAVRRIEQRLDSGATARLHDAVDIEVVLYTALCADWPVDEFKGWKHSSNAVLVLFAKCASSAVIVVPFQLGKRTVHS